MIVKENGRKVIIPKASPHAQAIRLLVEAFQAACLARGEVDAPPSRNDVKRLWRELDRRHKEVLGKIAPYPNGIPQNDLEKALGISAEELRGRNVGLSRICSRLNIDYPIRQTGYVRNNRRFYLNPDVAKTVLEMVNREAA